MLHAALALNGFRTERDAVDTAMAASLEDDATFQSICFLTAANEQKISELRKMQFPTKLPNGRPIPRLPTGHRETQSETRALVQAQNEAFERAEAEVRAAAQSDVNRRASLAERVRLLGPEPEKGIAVRFRLLNGRIVQRKFLSSNTAEDLYCWAAFQCGSGEGDFELRGTAGVVPTTGTLGTNKIVHRTLLTVLPLSD
jgi:hypothetical protein